MLLLRLKLYPIQYKVFHYDMPTGKQIDHYYFHNQLIIYVE
jgi:hypothetical protein